MLKSCHLFILTFVFFRSLLSELLQPILNFATNHTSLNVNWGFPQPVIFEYFNFSYSLIPGNATSKPSRRYNTSRIESILPLWQKNLELTNLIPGARYAVQLQAIGELTSSIAQSIKATSKLVMGGGRRRFTHTLFYLKSHLDFRYNKVFIHCEKHGVRSNTFWCFMRGLHQQMSFQYWYWYCIMLNINQC